jgi:hypothetical protein
VYLIQIHLPARGPDGPLPRDELGRVRAELSERFGGASFHLRTAVSFADEAGGRAGGDVLVAEVMARHQDREWWRLYREELQRRLGVESLEVRIIQCGLL